MKRAQLCQAALLLLVVSAMIAPRAEAQTVAAGPYYAVPSWDMTIDCSTPANCLRFGVLSNMNTEAVLDRETGLVWQRSPRATATSHEVAAQSCAQAQTGGRLGWRLPSVHELESLLVPKPVPAFTSALFLPDGHPFIGVQTEQYWTGTMRQGTDSNLLFWTIGIGTNSLPIPTTGPSIGPGIPGNAPFVFMWCVRGGGPISVY